MDKALADKDFLERIQIEFDPESMTAQRLEEFLYHGKRKKHEVGWGLDEKGEQRTRTIKGRPITSQTRMLAERLSKVSKIYQIIKGMRKIRDIPLARKKITDLPVHESTLIKEWGKKSHGVINKNVFSSLIKRASKEITKKSITPEDYKKLWKTNRSLYMRIYWRSRGFR